MSTFGESTGRKSQIQQIPFQLSSEVNQKENLTLIDYRVPLWQKQKALNSLRKHLDYKNIEALTVVAKFRQPIQE